MATDDEDLGAVDEKVDVTERTRQITDEQLQEELDRRLRQRRTELINDLMTSATTVIVSARRVDEDPELRRVWIQTTDVKVADLISTINDIEDAGRAMQAAVDI